MNFAKVLKITVLGAAVLGGAITLPQAFCDSSAETYALFGIAEQQYFAPVPAPYTPQQVTGVFWQFGFGNAGLNTGLDTRGIGMTGTASFNGNDSGTFVVNILDAGAIAGANFPQGSVGLGANNWANAGIDGCCDNPRVATFNYYNMAYGYNVDTAGYIGGTHTGDDNILNPYFDVYANNLGYAGVFSRVHILDYPTAVLLRTPGDAYFALAAVTSMDRDNTGGMGVCAPANVGPPGAPGPGTNTAPCDLRQGFYNFGEITNGQMNVLTSLNNVVPWQSSRPRMQCLADCSGTTPRQMQLEVGPIRWYHDGRSVLSTNTSVAAPRSPGVGVVDLLKRWSGMISITIQSAPVVLDGSMNINYPALVWTNVTGQTNLPQPLNANGDPTGPLVRSLTAPADTCYRAVVTVGKPFELSSFTVANCRNGRCGDRGFTIASADAAAVTCVGGALVSENISSSALQHSRGVFTLDWSTSTELSVQGFDIFAVSRGAELKVGHVNCKECTTSLPADYSLTLSRGDLRGTQVEAFRIQMLGGDGDSVTLDVDKPRGGGRR